ncbi:MAG: pyruvate kinase [Bacteroidota bacterium]|nr:pyruvate kinase [Bacteroidota bacterium]MDP4275107.1 pyruvate kinase [Bacteroidota bacterium]
MRLVRSHTKVIATLGPASNTREVMYQMIEEGVDVFRLNFSHSNQEEHKKCIQIINSLNEELHTNIAILADLQGPKLRIGEVENNLIEVADGDLLTFVTEKCMGTKEHLYLSYQQFPHDVEIGDTILIDDGKIQLEVTETNRHDKVKAKVIHGGPISSKKGVNLPNTDISMPSLTLADIDNANFAIENQVDWVALSFVRSAKDILDLKELIASKKGHAGVIAKIEKPEALLDIDKIIDAADGVMVARGDLGVEVPFDQVPLIQKQIINKCIWKSKPVIIATQMMESMITNFRPTRAEATDVANAVLDGADALMLSGETSVGKYPAGVIRNMQKIIDYTEANTENSNGFPFNREHAPQEHTNNFISNSICYNAYKMSQQTGAKGIINFSHTGYTAYRISGHRPVASVFSFTNNRTLLRKLQLVWGVRAYYYDKLDDIDESINYTIQFLKDKGLLHTNDAVIHIVGTPLWEKGQANMMKLSIVP